MAHPHIWVDYWIEAQGDARGITALRMTWRFDAMFSQMLRGDLGIKALTPDAIARLRDKAFTNLKNYHYYTYITADGAIFRPENTSDFTARLKGEQLEYSFTIPLPQPARKLDVTLYDEELYVDIGPPMADNGDNGGSMMKKTKPVAAPFVTARGNPAPVCTQRQGESRQSPLWGEFKTFIAACEAGS